MSDLIQDIGHAITLVTRLRALSEKKTKDAELKGLLDDVLLHLAEVQLKVEDLVNESAALKGQVHANPQGERCPRCQELGWKISGTRPHKSGRTAQIYSCPKCGLKEEVLSAPK